MFQGEKEIEIGDIREIPLEQSEKLAWSVSRLLVIFKRQLSFVRMDLHHV